jgi:starvation-inducible DNA-binding protein
MPLGHPCCLLLVLGQAAVARTARSLVPPLAMAGDQPSADPLSQRLPIRETTTWPLPSLLEG